MKTPLQLVRDFHTAFNLPKDRHLPVWPEVQLRMRLHKEEYEEAYSEMAIAAVSAMQGKAIPNRENLTKELCDLLYVVYGTGVAFGLDLDGGLREVHRSNMSKLDEDGRPLHFPNGKVKKGPNYTEANMAPFTGVVDELP